MLVKVGFRGVCLLEESYGFDFNGWGRERRVLCYCYVVNYVYFSGLKYLYSFRGVRSLK